MVMKVFESIPQVRTVNRTHVRSYVLTLFFLPSLSFIIILFCHHVTLLCNLMQPIFIMAYNPVFSCYLII